MHRRLCLFGAVVLLVCRGCGNHQPLDAWRLRGASGANIAGQVATLKKAILCVHICQPIFYIYIYIYICIYTYKCTHIYTHTCNTYMSQTFAHNSPPSGQMHVNKMCSLVFSVPGESAVEAQALPFVIRCRRTPGMSSQSAKRALMARLSSPLSTSPSAPRPKIAKTKAKAKAKAAGAQPAVQANKKKLAEACFCSCMFAPIAPLYL